MTLTKALDAVCKDKTVSPGLLSRGDVSHFPDVLDVLEADELFHFFDKFLEGETVTTEYKWLRAVNYNKFTGMLDSQRSRSSSGVHMDRVYMGQGTGKLCTGKLSIPTTANSISLASVG